MANYQIKFAVLKGIDGRMYAENDIVEQQYLFADDKGKAYLEMVGAIAETEEAPYTQAEATGILARKDAEIKDLKLQLEEHDGETAIKLGEKDTIIAERDKTIIEKDTKINDLEKQVADFKKAATTPPQKEATPVAGK